MYAGLCSVIAVILLYFSRVNRNFVAIIGERATKTLNPRRVIIAKARAGMSLRTRVDYYLATPTRLASPDPNDPAELRQLVRILNQNHGNALFLEFILLLLIMGLGLLEENPTFQIPAGASVFFLFSIFLMLVSAIVFWFRKLGPLAMIVVVLIYLAFDNIRVFQTSILPWE
jgi:hypothetical protein